VLNKAEAFLTLRDALDARGLAPEAAAAHDRAIERLRARATPTGAARFEPRA
jgi:hypothetical protein